jgi:pyruvate/2-oxoacid:ferredoxin oxidoreductase alpha subunit
MADKKQEMVTLKTHEIAPMIRHYENEIADKETKLKIYEGGRIDTYLRDNQSPPPTVFKSLPPTHQYTKKEDAEKFVRANPDDQTKEWRDNLAEYKKWRGVLMRNKSSPNLQVPREDFDQAILTSDGFRIIKGLTVR